MRVRCESGVGGIEGCLETVADSLLLPLRQIDSDSHNKTRITITAESEKNECSCASMNGDERFTDAAFKAPGELKGRSL